MVEGIRALGPRTAALMTTDDALAGSFDDAAADAGESLWDAVDLAGPAFNMGEPYDGVPAGGTGYGVRTLVELLDRL